MRHDLWRFTLTNNSGKDMQSSHNSIITSEDHIIQFPSFFGTRLEFSVAIPERLLIFPKQFTDLRISFNSVVEPGNRLRSPSYRLTFE